jgi:hypothetical protein
MNTTITRTQFLSALEKIFGNNYDKLFDKILEGFTTTNYKCFYYEATIYIVDLYNEELIIWYNLGHIGRALKITKDDATIKYIENMFKEFKNELNL